MLGRPFLWCVGNLQECNIGVSYTGQECNIQECIILLAALCSFCVDNKFESCSGLTEVWGTAN